MRGTFLPIQLILICALLLAGCTPPVALASGPTDEPAGWFNAAWQHRQAVTIANPTGRALGSYQARVDLGANFPFGQAQPGGEDLRVTAGDGVSPLPFYIERWEGRAASASLWVRLPGVPREGARIYLYYGSAAARSQSDGRAVFELFDDFETPLAGYFKLGEPRTVMVRDQLAWEDAAPHTLSVIELNRDGYRYWGYYGLKSAMAAGLARSNDLVNWNKYPLPLIMDARWPSVMKVDNVIYMAVTRAYRTDSLIELHSSRDGLTFTRVKTLVQPSAGHRNQNPALFYDPPSGKYYLFWYSNNAGRYEVRASSAGSISELGDQTYTVVLASERKLAAPQVMYYDGIYYLSTEVQPEEWETKLFVSAVSPTEGYVEIPGNPVLANGEACMFQHIFEGMLHNYYCKLTGDVWTLDHRSADLSAGREVKVVIDPGRWSSPHGHWTVVEGTSPAPGRHTAASPTTGDPLLTAQFSGQNYTAQAALKLEAGQSAGFALGGGRFSVLVTTGPDGDARVALLRTEDGRSAALNTASAGKLHPGSWHTLTVRAYNQRIDVWLDGAHLLHSVRTGPHDGWLGLYAAQGSRVQFDQVQVRQYGGADLTGALVEDR